MVHDYLTQRGGAERVVLSMLRAFPDSPIYTSVYSASETFAEFRSADVRTTGLDSVRLLRSHHRLAFPVLASTYSRLAIDVDLAICSSSGWAHATKVSGKKVVYCHAPARWLYQADRYFPNPLAPTALAVRSQRSRLRAWDRRAAATADLYLVNSRAVRDQVKHIYGIDARVVPPPPRLGPGRAAQPPGDLEPGFLLTVARLLPYKNVHATTEAFSQLPDERLVVVGSGPAERSLRRHIGANVRLIGAVSDPEMRWLYQNCVGVVAASYEDFGLTPLEAARFGKPSATLRFGGFLDTVLDGETGLHFQVPDPSEIAAAVRRLRNISWSSETIAAHADTFSEERFCARLRDIACEVLA